MKKILTLMICMLIVLPTTIYGAELNSTFKPLNGEGKSITNIYGTELNSVLQPAYENEDGIDAGIMMQNTDVQVNVAALNGPTGMGMAFLNEQSDLGNTEYKYDIAYAASPDELTGGLISGEIEIAALPVNLASVLYNKTEGQIQVLAANTLGVLYIVGNDNSESENANQEGRADLNQNSTGGLSCIRNKKIIASGKASTPEYVLKYLLESNDIVDSVEVEYVSQHDEAVTALASGQAELIMIPEPKVTAALMQIEGSDILVDLNKEWEVATGTELVQGVIVVQKEFAAGHPEIVESFLEDYETSVDFANENMEEASALMERYGIIPKAAIALMAIPNCNIVFMDGDEMKMAVNTMLQVLYDEYPASVGGALPGDDFYY